MVKLIINKRVFVLPSLEEDREIIAAALADPDAQPMTDESMAYLRPVSEFPEIQERLRKLFSK